MDANKQRKLVKLIFERSHPKHDWRNDREYVFLDITGKSDEEFLVMIEEARQSVITENLPNVEYLCAVSALDFDYLLPLLEALPEPFDEPEINKYHNWISFSLNDETELKMEDMVTLIEFCKEHDLTFEMTSDYDATDRCGFLAYDSVVTPYIKIYIKNKES